MRVGKFNRVTSSVVTSGNGGSKSSAGNYTVDKWFYDYADNIEAVNIHYACTPIGEVPDWNGQRVTRFLPLVGDRMRRRTLKLPAQVFDPNTGQLCDRYLLHHYFEIFADGDTHYSPLYTEEVLTGAGSVPAPLTPIDAAEPGGELQHSRSATGKGEMRADAGLPPGASKKPRARSRAGKGK